MRKGLEIFNQYYKKGSVLAVAVACTVLFSCNDTARNDSEEDAPTSADANSVQDTMAIDTGPGGGLAYDTSGVRMQGTGPDSITSTVEPRKVSPNDSARKNVYSQ